MVKDDKVLARKMVGIRLQISIMKLVTLDLGLYNHTASIGETLSTFDLKSS